MGSQRLSFDWKNYDSNIKTSFQDFLVDDTLVDVTLVASDQSVVRAHKLVLAAACSYFRELFARISSSGGIQGETVVVLPNVSRSDVNSLMQYWYSGQMNATKEQLPTLRALADMLRVRGLARLIDSQPTTHQKPNLSQSVSHMDENRMEEYSEDDSQMYTRSPAAGRKRRRRKSPTPPVTETPASILPTPTPIKTILPDPAGGEDSDDSITELAAEVKHEVKSVADGDGVSYSEGGYAEGTSQDQYGGEQEYQGSEYYSEESGAGGTAEDGSYYYGQDPGDDSAMDGSMGYPPDGIPPGGEGSSSQAEADFLTSAEFLQCPICKNVFTNKETFNAHIKVCGDTRKRLICLMCPKTFTDQCSLRRHLKGIHKLGKDDVSQIMRNKVYTTPK